MTEKVASKGDPCRYEIIHVVGSFRPLPHPTPTKPTSAHTPSPTTVPSRDLGDSGRKTSCDSDLEDAEVMQVVQRSGTHMLVCFVRVVKDRPINELSLVESTQDEYITLFTSSQGQGVVSYRLRCKDGTHVTLRSRGYIEMNKQTGQVDTFVCINTVMPPELRDGMKQTISSENFRKIIASIDPHLDKELSQNPVAPQEDSSPQMPTPAGMTNSLCTQKKTSTKHGHFSGHVRKDYSDTGCSPQSTVQEPKTIIVDNPCIEATRKRGSEEDLCNVPSKKMGVMPVLAQTEQKSSYKPPNNSLEVQHKTNLVNSGSHLSKSPLHDQRQIGFLNNSSQNSIIDDHSPAGDNLTRVIGSLFMMDNKKQLENVSTSESSFSNQIGYSSEYSTGTYHQMSDFTPAHEDSYQPTRTNVISCAINNSFECDNSGSVKQNGRQKYRNDVMASKCNFQSDCLSSKKLHSVQHQNRGQTETSNHDSQMFPQNQVYSQQEVSTKQVSQYQDGGCLSYGQQFIPPQTNISSHQGCQLSLPSSSDLNFKIDSITTTSFTKRNYKSSVKNSNNKKNQKVWNIFYPSKKKASTNNKDNIARNSSTAITYKDEDYQLCESSSGTTVENSLFHQYGANFQPQIVDQFSVCKNLYSKPSSLATN
ncbi:putative PAS domain-containing protein, partial [Homarus americanus]